MDLLDLHRYGEFGFVPGFIEDPDDPTSVYSARKSLVIFPDELPIHKQLKLKRISEGLSQKDLGRILRLPASTVSLIETGQRICPRKSLRLLEHYLYECHYSEGKLVEEYVEEEDQIPPVMLSVEEQRAYWKEILDNTDLHGTIL